MGMAMSSPMMSATPNRKSTAIAEPPTTDTDCSRTTAEPPFSGLPSMRTAPSGVSPLEETEAPLFNASVSAGDIPGADGPPGMT